MESLSETSGAAEWPGHDQRVGTMLPSYPDPQNDSTASGTTGKSSPQIVEKPVSAIRLPLLEAGPGSKRQVRSERGDEVYTVNLAQYTCTCHSFKKGRSRFEVGDFRRCCRHISRLLLYEKRTGKLSDFLHVMIVQRLNYGRGIWADTVRHPMRYFQLDGDDVLLVKGDSIGVDVFAPKPSPNPGYGIFGYSYAKVRWTNLGMPKHHELIAELVHQWVETLSQRASPSTVVRAMSEAQPRAD